MSAVTSRKTSVPAIAQRRETVAFGPETPGWGSWEWVGDELSRELASRYETRHFQWNEVPHADVVVIVKHPPPFELVAEIPDSSRIIYCPVDHYGSTAEIDADAATLMRCDRIVIHCERLRKYFQSYAPVVYLDHHVKFVPPRMPDEPSDGFILWTGVRSNLPPLVDWVNANRLPRPLVVLTNLEDPTRLDSAEQFGFAQSADVRIEHWTAERHLALVAQASAALDIKGDDFRSAHKPPAKALDFIASGLPLAMNRESNSVEHLARIGFEIASPEETERWLSRDYWEETRRFGGAIREVLSRDRIGRRLSRVIDELLLEKPRRFG